MLDVLVPIPFSNRSLVTDCLEAFEKNTDFPFRFVGVVDGGSREDVEEVRVAFQGCSVEWQLLHNETPVYLNQTLREGLEECSQRVVAIMGPEVRLADKSWFAKVKAILDRDPAAAIIDMWPGTKSATLHPVKRTVQNRCKMGCRFAVVRREFAMTNPPFGEVDPINHWSWAAVTGGWSSWAAPGVLYHETDHEEHELWRAPLAVEDRSE